MVICNIVYEKMDEVLEKYKDVEFVNLVDKHWKIKTKTPTLIYGYRLAQQLFPNDVNPNAKSSLFKIKHNLHWSYTESELSEQQWVYGFIREALNSHLSCYHNDIDVIFNDFDMDSFVRKLSEFPLIHAGKYEIYVGDIDNGVVVHSFQMDNLKYAEMDPEEFFYELINRLEGRCVVLSTDEIDLTRTKYVPISFQDLAMAKYNKKIDFIDVLQMIRGHLDYVSKEMLITFFLKHDLYSKTLFKNFI